VASKAGPDVTPSFVTRALTTGELKLPISRMESMRGNPANPASRGMQYSHFNGAASCTWAPEKPGNPRRISNLRLRFTYCSCPGPSHAMQVWRPEWAKRKALMIAHADVSGSQGNLERGVVTVERRRGRRFSLWLSCRVIPASTESVEYAGTVIDISRSGVLVGLDSVGISRLPGLDDVVCVKVALPQHSLSSPKWLECTATVVRILDAKAQTQVACEIGRMQVTC
jgi:hypothetical protein